MEEGGGLGSCVEAERERKVNQNEWEAPPLETEVLIKRQVRKHLQEPVLFSRCSHCLMFCFHPNLLFKYVP